MLARLHYKRGYWLFPLMILMMLLDGVLASTLQVLLSTQNYMIVPHLLLMTVTLFSFYATDEPVVIYAGIIGFLYDSYFIGYYGVYLCVFMVVAYLTRLISPFFSQNVLFATLIVILGMAVADGAVYLFYQFNGMTSMTWIQFMVQRMWPTLLFNTVLFFFIYNPLKFINNWIHYRA